MKISIYMCMTQFHVMCCVYVGVASVHCIEIIIPVLMYSCLVVLLENVLQ